MLVLEYLLYQIFLLSLKITAYSHKDDNNNWLIKKPDQEVSEGKGAPESLT